jgi:hypothetical protein
MTVAAAGARMVPMATILKEFECNVNTYKVFRNDFRLVPSCQVLTIAETASSRRHRIELPRIRSSRTAT